LCCCMVGPETTPIAICYFLALPALLMCSGQICAASVSQTSTWRIPRKSTRGADKRAPYRHSWMRLGLKDAVVAGYDVGSFVSQTLAAMRPDLVKALVVSPPLPGAGQRVLELEPVQEFWYTSFHQLDLAQHLVDGNREAVRAYLHHFWSHWSGLDYIVDEKRIDHLAGVYAAPGAFIASVNWYRSSSNPVTAYAAETKPSARDRLATPTTILWQDQDAIFPYRWSDRLDDFFQNYTLERLNGIGHFTPLEAPNRFAQAIKQRLAG
jgi:pimeloyl-ACP methyl ester carboxylesterase